MKKNLQRSSTTRDASAPAITSDFPELRNLWWKAALLLAGVGIVIYANSLHCSFQFDDNRTIAENSKIQNLFDLPAIWSFNPSRFLTDLSFALNYHFFRLNVVGYHITNILIHVVSSLFVFLLIYISTRTPLMRPKVSAADTWWISLFSSLIFLCHPIQTQAVTYIVQRAASLATLFYLRTMLYYAMARSNQNLRWYVAACIACIASMFTKETAFTLPLMIILYDFTFFDTHTKIGNQRLLWFLPFLATLSIIPWLTIHIEAENLAKGLPRIMEGSIPPLQYLLTQFNVIRTYIRLLFLPVGQSLVYDYPIATHFWEPQTILSFALLYGIFASAVWIFRRQRLIAFGIFWFFLALSVESSFISILDVIFEHRLYLPMVGFSIAFTSGVYTLCCRKNTFQTLTIAVIVILGVLTISRNSVWKTDLSLWQDAVRKAPGASRAHFCLALALDKQGRVIDAQREQQRAIDLDIQKWRSRRSTRVF